MKYAKTLRLNLLVLTVATFFCACQKEKKQEIFNGKDLTNWEHVGDGSFTIENGLLKTQGGMGLLYYTPEKLGDVTIRVVYKGADQNNAGVFIRIPEQPTEAWMPVNRGYEVQIDDREDEFHKTGVLYSLTKAKAAPGIPGEWNTMEITLDGTRTIVKVNDVLVTDFTEGDPVPEKKLDYEPDRGPRPAQGYIGLQNHGGDDVIYFKEVSLIPLKK
ncbi:3-keto-disaccharide hydrolase [Roseivirga pacifica]|uniref:3-keto-disaccharide hydrolase n=1 Tax=Roseivirga pacifica TaxID=1267423 RepID=UPI003BAF7AA8